jgi:hypothetical protein
MAVPRDVLAFQPISQRRGFSRVGDQRGTHPQFLSKRDCEAVNNTVLDRPKQQLEKDEPVVQEDLISRKFLFSVLDRNMEVVTLPHTPLVVDILARPIRATND